MDRRLQLANDSDTTETTEIMNIIELRNIHSFRDLQPW